MSKRWLVCLVVTVSGGLLLGSGCTLDTWWPWALGAGAAWLFLNQST